MSQARKNLKIAAIICLCLGLIFGALTIFAIIAFVGTTAQGTNGATPEGFVDVGVGAIGVILSLVVTGRALSMIAFMAIVMLIGVVVNNAILLLDSANQHLRSGQMGRRSAILTAGKEKFQAIMLATFASIVAQLPLAFGIGGDVATSTQPMGIASVGGLLISAILTMYLIPTFFWLPNAIFHKAKKKVAMIKEQRAAKA